jgi:ubiquitin-like-conjugating enzyme ATG3
LLLLLLATAALRYLVLFLKFIASVVPTVQYDYTMSVGGQ